MIRNSILIILLLILSGGIINLYGQPTAVSISASPTSVCLDNSTDTKPVILTATITGNLSSNASNYQVEFHDANNNYILYSALIFSNNQYTYSFSVNVGQNYYQFSAHVYDITTKPNPTPICQSTNLSIGVYVKPSPQQSTSNSVSLLTTNNYYDLNNLLTNTNGATLTFQPDPSTPLPNGAISNGHILHPNLIPPGNYKIQYRACANNNSCCTSWTTFTFTFSIVDPNATLPFFISNISPLPICENSNRFYLNVSVSLTCFNGSVPSTLRVFLNYNGVSGPFEYASYAGNDPTGTSAQYFFGITPRMRDPNNYYIYVSSIDDNGSGYLTNCNGAVFSGYIPIFPRRNPLILGIPPAPVNSNISTICAASKDTVFMRGSPSSGSYNFYVGKKNGPFTLLASNKISPYLAPPEDASYIRFIPSEVFKTYLASDTSNYVKVEYVYPPNGTPSCPDTTIRYMKFIPSDSTRFIVTKPTQKPYCYGDSIQLSVVYVKTIPNANDKFSWDFGDGFVQAFQTPKSVTHLYANPGKYIVRFKAQNINLSPGVCDNDIKDSIFIGAKPTANFDVFNNFENVQGTYKNLSHINVPNLYAKNIQVPQKDTIYKWKWNFGDNIIGTNTIKGDTVHTYLATQRNPYRAVLTVTSGWGCQDSIIRYIPAFPVKVPSNSIAYTENFNSITSANGFYQSGQYQLPNNTVSSWLNQSAVGKVIQSGNPCWITSKAETKPDTTGYFNNERSWVESPCLDLSQIPLPMMSMDIWSQTDKLFDGATVQYTLCDSAFGKEKWVTLGVANSGLNWFNSNIIISSPGGNPPLGTNLYGWTGTDNTKGWSNAAYSLSAVKDSAQKHNVPYIRLRVAFSSNNDNTPGKTFDGFAFDNFFVGQRNRNVLIEEFCDYNHLESGFEVSSFNKNPQLIRMQYHTRYMALDDQINNQNIGESGARDLLYGISQLPRAAVDGYYSNDTQNPFFGNQGEQSYDRRILETSPFTISFNNPTVSGNQLNFNVTMTRDIVNNNEGPFVLEVAVLEDSVFANGKSFSNVFRKFLPHAAGEHVDKNNWLSGASNAKLLNRSFTPFTKLTPRNKDTDNSLVLVAFIQDEATSEIYQAQAAYVKYGVVKNLAPVALPKRVDQGSTGFLLYPNPTQTELSVSFDQGLATEDYTYHILNAYGQTILSGVIEKNTTIASITNIPSLTVGVYQFQLLGNSSSETKTFTIVR